MRNLPEETSEIHEDKALGLLAMERERTFNYRKSLSLEEVRKRLGLEKR